MIDTRRREGGQPATRLVDFLNHVHGVADRHTADQLDMNPPLTSAMGALSDSTVQGTLEKIGTFLANAGQGFVSIGEGYDVVAADFNVGVGSSPNLAAAFNNAFAHPRLVNGGIILVKAGTYYLSSTVSVPPGIMIMGELGGTIINGLTVEQPMFIIKRALDHAHLTSTGILSTDPVDKTQFFNITLTDGYVNSSFTPLMTTVPMIRCETGAYFTCEQVTFLGKMGTLGAGPGFGRSKTLYAIGYSTVGAEETTTILERCVIDGVRSVVNFAPGSSTDKLTINNCKVRVFGSEAAADNADPTKNCFVLVSGTGFIKITNNYFNPGISGGIIGQSYVTSLATYTSGNPSFIIAGNTGSIAFSMGVGQESLVNDNGTGSIANVSAAANLWNNQNFSNQWFITIGDGVYSVGDITGTTALNTALSYVLGTSQSLAEIYINYGSYTYSSAVSLDSNYVLIGRKHIDGSRPQITLNVGDTAVDYLGNRYITVGSRIEHLTFVSQAGTRHQSVYVMRDGLKGQVYVNDCEFIDTSLVIEKMTVDSAFININNCNFNSTGIFANNLQLLAPPTHSTRVTACLFKGSDYAVAIGTFPAINYIDGYVGQSIREIILDNISFELDLGTQISGNSPLGSNRYITILDTISKVFLNKISISALPAQIDPLLLDNFDKWIEIMGYDIEINDSLCTGIDQLTNGGNIVIPFFYITPIVSFKLNKSLIQSAFPLQVSGELAFIVGATGANGVFVNDCQILAFNNNTTSTTLLDIDVSLGSLSAIPQNGTLPIIDISGNSFANNGTGAVTKHAIHMFNDSFHCGCVQIFGHGFDIHVNNNNIMAATQITNLASSVAALYIDAYNAPVGSNGSPYSKVNVSDNTVYAINYYISGSGFDTAAAMWVNCSYLNVSNNNITMISSGSSNDVCVLYLQNTATNNGTVAGSLNSGVVTGNAINRLADNASSVMTGGYVIIENTSGRGTLVDNEFDALTFDGSNTVLVRNLGQPWNISRNRNQTATIELSLASAVYSMNTASGTIPLCINYDTLSIDSFISTAGLPTLPANDVIIIAYQDLSTNIYYNIFWGLNSVLPKDVKIQTISCTYNSLSGTFSTTGDLSLNVSSQNSLGVDAGVFSDSADLTSTTSGTLTATANNPECFNTNTDNPVAYIHLLANSAGFEAITFGPINLTYYW